MVLTDPSGDQLSPEGPGTRSYLDIEGLFFSYEDSPGPRITANQVVHDLSMDVAVGSNPRGAVIWEWDGRHRFVRASGGLLDLGLLFQYGNFNPATRTFDVIGETPGRFHEGRHGIIEMEIPASIGGTLGETLTGPYVVTYEGNSSQAKEADTGVVDARNATGDPVLVPADRGPDVGTGDDFVVGATATTRGSPESGDCTEPDPVPPVREHRDGPCTEAAADSMPDGHDHDHADVAQHRFACRMRQVFFDSLADELQPRSDVVLGEMDVEDDLAAVAVVYPESGVLFFDVSDPALPVFLSRYRGSACEQVAFKVNCGAFVDLSSDGTRAFLSVQSLTALSGEAPDPAVRPVSEPGVEVIDVRDPRSPRLAYAHPVVSTGGVHTSRSHVIPDVPADGGTRAPGEYVFSVANDYGVEITRVDHVAGTPVLTPVKRFPVSLHDTFLQNDPLTGRTYLYVAAGFESGFYMYDVTNPATPVLLAEWDPTPHCADDWYSHTIDVAVRHGRRYVTIGAEVFDRGPMTSECGSVIGNGDRPGPLWIVDATVPSQLGPAWDSGSDDVNLLRRSSETALVTTWTNPANRAGGTLRFSPHNQQIVGDWIYLSHYHGGVYVLDASEAFRGKRKRPREIGFIVPHGDEARPTSTSHPLISLGRPAIWDVVHHKGYALAADMHGGLYSLRLESFPPHRIAGGRRALA